MAEKGELTRFQPGHPGGPGRPKNVPIISDIIRRVGMEEIGYKGEKITLWEAAIRKAFGEAIQGKAWALQLLVERVEGKALQKSEVEVNRRKSSPDEARAIIELAHKELQDWDLQQKLNGKNVIDVEPIPRSE